MLADVDGTLVTPDKQLTERAIEAVQAMDAAGVVFAITSGRPPRGMAMLVEPLGLRTPIAAFNGGVVVRPDMTVIEQRTVPADLVPGVAQLVSSFGLDVWTYRGADWYVPNAEGPHVAREAATVQFEPTVVADIGARADGIAKIVGVSDNQDAMARATDAVHGNFGDHVSAATSQPYYLDVTHPDANKGVVLRWLAGHYRIPLEETATIGDMANDVLMFAHSGLSIAMGNADPQVQRAARRVTDTNDADGFAKAVERFVLPRAPGSDDSGSDDSGSDDSGSEVAGSDPQRRQPAGPALTP
jgi:Cof subfamily protein (haloacid dehalogenase superfamily)